MEREMSVIDTSEKKYQEVIEAYKAKVIEFDQAVEKLINLGLTGHQAEQTLDFKHIYR
jgi:hypothetical protein